MKQASYLVTLFFVLLLICSVQNAWAQIPQTISYQGVLADAGGAAVPDGNYQLTFKLYDAETGGNELWSEAHNTVAVNNGVFSVILGETTSFNLLFDQQYWLDATIGTDPPLSPRIALTASPYSLNPQGGGNGDGHSLDAADGSPTDALFVDNDGNVGIGTLSPGAELEVAGQLKITGGTPGAGKVLTSDASGLATWENAAGSDNDWTISGNDLFSAVSGNVGIGTTSPQDKLHLNEGELRITTTSDGNRSISFYDADEEWGELRSRSTSGAAGGLVLGAKRSDDASPLQLASFIGTDAGPDAMFRFTAFKYTTEAAEIEDLGGIGPLLTKPIFAIENYDVNNPLLQVEANGNVGIGTTSPTEKLTVAGTIESTSGGIRFPDGTLQTTAGGTDNDWVITGAICMLAFLATWASARRARRCCWMFRAPIRYRLRLLISEMRDQVACS